MSPCTFSSASAPGLSRSSGSVRISSTKRCSPAVPFAITSEVFASFRIGFTNADTYMLNAIRSMTVSWSFMMRAPPTAMTTTDIMQRQNSIVE